MIELPASQLVDRLNRLEDENRCIAQKMRRMKRLLSLGFLALVTPWIMGAFQVPDVIHARRFVVLDKQDNKERISIGVSPQGEASIAIKDLEGRDHIRLYSSWNGEDEELQVVDMDGKKVMAIGANRNSHGIFNAP